MNEELSTWNEVRRIADELALEIHLAGMEARDRWRALQPRLASIEKSISSAGKHATEVVEREVSSIGAALRRLKTDIAASPKSS
jgi:IS1 family transposase